MASPSTESPTTASPTEASSDADDTEGEELGLCRPSLIRELRGVLDEYPDDGQILKELIQNAEDADARSVVVIADSRTFHRQLDKATLKTYPHLQYLQGPALCVYNDAVFSKDDWKGIRMLHDSIKDKDPLKVGRFGLGFKSVFHLTDCLAIISGNYIMYMDPFKGEQHYCWQLSLSSRKGKEVESLLHCVPAIFGLSRATFSSQGSGFKGTLFWLPLRGAPSDLSSTVYTSERLNSLLEAFKNEASTMLLFLKSMEQVQLFSRCDKDSALKQLFSVKIAPSCLDKVRHERERIVTAVRKGVSTLPDKGVTCVTLVTNIITDHVTRDEEVTETWLVAVFQAGKRDMTPRLTKLCQDKDLGYRPCVGIAAPLKGQQDFRSQLFCFLPLPLDTRSPTGLPVHVHGCFALSQNRRHIKWPNVQLTQLLAIEASTLWNCLLVRELLPEVYSHLLNRLREIYAEDPARYYACLPDASKIEDRWRPLLAPLFTNLMSQSIFYSTASRGDWILPSEALLVCFEDYLLEKLHLSREAVENLEVEARPAVSTCKGTRDTGKEPGKDREKDEGIEVMEAVISVYQITNQNIVKLPHALHKTLAQLGLLQDIKVVSAELTVSLLPACLPHLSESVKMNLLLYFSCHNDAVNLLFGQSLLPLHDGSFGTFLQGSRKKKNSAVFLASEELVLLFPGLEARFCRTDINNIVKEMLQRTALSGRTTLKILKDNSTEIPELIQQCLKYQATGGQKTLPASDPWIQQLWAFLASTEPWCQDLSCMGSLSMLPFLDGQKINLMPLSGTYISMTHPGLTTLTYDLVSCLQRLGVIVFLEVPDYVIKHSRVMGCCIQYPTTQGILNVLRQIAEEKWKLKEAVQNMNVAATRKEADSLVSVLKNASADEFSMCSSLLKQLKIFSEVQSQRLVSVCEVQEILPDLIPPVLPPRGFLSHRQQHLAVQLGARKVSLKGLVKETLTAMASEHTAYSERDLRVLVDFCLDKISLVNDGEILTLARQVRFVPDSTGRLNRSEDLYDPSSQLLKELFCFEEKFPHTDFYKGSMKVKLKTLGLRGEDNIKPEDIIKSARLIQDLQSETEKASRKAAALLTLLKVHGKRMEDSTLTALSELKCLQCVQETDKPPDYPISVPLWCVMEVCQPSVMYSKTLLHVVGSIFPVLKENLPQNVMKCLRIRSLVRGEDVLQHLKNVVDSFQTSRNLHLQKLQSYTQSNETPQYRTILYTIFRWLQEFGHEPDLLNKLEKMKCILIEAGDMFCEPKCFWVERSEDDIDLRPYCFHLPFDMMHATALLSKCGSRKRQDVGLLEAVLGKIRDIHGSLTSACDHYRKDLKLVKRILDTLVNTEAAAESSVLLPICHSLDGVLRFKPARECTVFFGSDNTRIDVDDNDLFFVHLDIPLSTALSLGALKIKDRSLVDLEDLDYGFGQHEKLTSRLHSLLEDSYTDGFSVPKELIQNADDAGAKTVSFLLDERENLGSRINLIYDNMASLQGPALFVYNDAVFTAQDLENIQKLGEGTKRQETAKIGKFGLGFNSVYNLTDVPCFISGHTMAMFDPHVKYLKGPGLKLDLTRPNNRALLSRMPEQFHPFQGIFGCKLEKAEAKFNGTLFRLPLRTLEQARDSKIKPESYTESKRRDFLRLLLERAGSLLLFTQNVTKLDVLFLPHDAKDPSEAQTLLTVFKSPLCLQSGSGLPVDLQGQSIIQHCTTQWANNINIQLVEDIQIDMETTTSAKYLCDVQPAHTVTQWRTSWATGTRQSAKLAKSMKGVIPLASASIMIHNGQLELLQDCPPGFYNSGHLFCFMPLPEEAVHAIFPVHINGTFALSSNRRSLLLQTEDDLKGSHGSCTWNIALLSDAVCRAYFNLLENLQSEAVSDFTKYFSLWPTTAELGFRDNFFSHLVSSHSSVLPVTDSLMMTHWVDFETAVFLDSRLRNSSCWDIAWKTMQKFFKHADRLVDLPLAVEQNLKSAGHSQLFEANTISEEAFYRDVFLPNISDDSWIGEERDMLVYHALIHENSLINSLLMKSACIPCAGTGQLRCPQELIHPNGTAADLFDLEDGRFPKKNEPPDNKVDFCSHDALCCLVRLGMVTDDLPIEILLDRAKSVDGLRSKGFEKSCHRAADLITFLSVKTSGKTKLDCLLADNINLIRSVHFLPVLSKPKEWPFAWAGGVDSFQLAAPKDLFCDNMKELLACEVKLLDSQALGLPLLADTEKRKILMKLGVITDTQNKDDVFLNVVIRQLLSIVNVYADLAVKSYVSSEVMQDVCCKIYAYLSKCLDSEDNVGREQTIEVMKKKLNVPIVWTGNSFAHPARVVLECRYNCHPFLFQLESGIKQYSPFFQAVGVRDKFEAADVITVLHEIRDCYQGQELPDDHLVITSQLSQLLCSIMKEQGENFTVDTSSIFLPDKHRHMQPVSNLCLDDCDWLSESLNMKFVNECISASTANTLGIRTKKDHDYDALVEYLPFGQHEDLTSRIKRLLEGYMCDSSIFKELLQNADDAGATEVKFILDLRTLGREKVLGRLEKLQGPALCVYNNSSFTTKDLEGIQNLGQSNKEQDSCKTGQYGVGFNAVYHITDVPSFWTLVDESTETLCVLDPNRKYVHNKDLNRPGIKITDMNRVREAYSDMFAGYFPDVPDVLDMSKPGTLFRLPLRTTEMAETSEIKTKPMNLQRMRGLLSDFKSEMFTCLLFLNNIRKIGLYTMSTEGVLQPDDEAIMHINYTNNERFQDFKERVQNLSELNERGQVDLGGIGEFDTFLEVTLTNKKNVEENWLVVHRMGFSNCNDPDIQEMLEKFKLERYKLLPSGGIAIQLKKKEPYKDPVYHVFCTLPLREHSKFPAHVNGAFVLSHEARHDIFTAAGNPLSAWNKSIATNVIVPAYITVLQILKEMNFPQRQIAPKSVQSKFGQYYTAFPDIWSVQVPCIWESAVKRLYQHVAELPLFPVLEKTSVSIQWVPAVSKEGFAGVFSDMKRHFQSQLLLSEGHGALVNVVTESAEHTLAQVPSEDMKNNETPTEDLQQRLAIGNICTKTTLELCERMQKAHTLAEEFHSILHKLNIKVLDAPYRLFTYFHKSEVNTVKEVTPVTLLEFLKSWGQDNGCSVKDLPKPVHQTPLESRENVVKLLEFLSGDKAALKNIDNVPLCLRQSQTLYNFSKDSQEKPVIWDRLHLLPGSSEDFLHKDIQQFFSTENKAFYRNLDISLFAKLLPKTLNDPSLSSGVPCHFGIQIFPSEDWLNNTWEFLQNELDTKLKRPKEPQKLETREEAHNMLHCLADWNLIPVTDKTRGKLLFPLKQMTSVIYIPEEELQANLKLQQILQELPLSFLDIHSLPQNSVLTSLVASITHPRALLSALVNCLDSTHLANSEKALVILNYFSDNLESMAKSYTDAEKDELKNDLRHLPLYCAVDGQTLYALSDSVPAFCLSSNIPMAGLVEWSQKREGKIIIMREEKIPKDLFNFLGISVVIFEQFYIEYLLPTFSALPWCAILVHITAIRGIIDELKSYLKTKHGPDKTKRQEAKMQSAEQSETKHASYKTEKENDSKEQIILDSFSALLKGIAFMEKNGVLYKASDFNSPHHPVLKAMSAPDKFPPENYCTVEWKYFLELAGIVHKVTQPMFIEFALALEGEAKGKPIDENLAKKSTALSTHLFKGKDLVNDEFLSIVKCIQFIRPSEWRSCEEHKPLLDLIAPTEPDTLVAFSESCSEDDLFIIWSCYPVIHPKVVSLLEDSRLKEKKEMQNLLGLSHDVPKYKVFAHVTKLCNVLAEKGPEELIKFSGSELLTNIMEKVYGYFKYRCKDNIEALQHLPIIFDPIKNMMLKPHGLVIELTDKEAIPGYIQRAPQCFGQYFGVFKRLGVSDNVSAKHYAVVLRALASSNKPLHVEELKTVEKAVKQLFFCLKTLNKDQQLLNECVLYLPSGSQLYKSTELVFVDDEELWKRMSETECKLKFFCFSDLEIHIPSPKDEMNRLPKHLQPLWLSKLLREFIPEHVKQNQVQNAYTRHVEEKFEDPGFIRGVIRLCFNQCKNDSSTNGEERFDDEWEKKIETALGSISVKEVPDLVTVLERDGVVMEGSKRRAPSFVDSCKEFPCSCTVYIDSTTLRTNLEEDQQSMFYSLATAVQTVVGLQCVYTIYLKQLCDVIGRGLYDMDKCGLLPYNAKLKLARPFIPRPGENIPVSQHCYLDNSFFDFYPGEHVGLEVYDPSIECDEGQLEDEPVFIYAVIQCRIETNSEEPVLRNTYLVSTGKASEEFFASKLYKFIRRNVQTQSEALVETAEGLESPPAIECETSAENLISVLREIRETLLLAWQIHSTKADRMRVVKRLYLRWHPDKNITRQSLCTKVIQILTCYVGLLEQGRPLPEDDSTDNNTDDDFHSTGNNTEDNTEAFFCRMKKRAGSYRRYFDSNEQDDYGNSSRSSRSRGFTNPQPAEGKRWLRQAEADLTSACSANGVCDKGRNWVCYMCYQAVEKSLKAVLYRRNAHLPSLFDSIDLRQLAGSVDDDVMRDVARDLTLQLGHPSRMNSPEPSSYPRIPAELYTADHVEEALKLAQLALDRARELMSA